jgi:thiamine biosynthesis lipoprotein
MVVGSRRLSPYDQSMPINTLHPRCLRTLYCTLLILAGTSITGCDQQNAHLNFDGPTMGTQWSIRLAECSDSQCQNLQADIEQRLSELNQNLSHYEADSEVWRFNQSASLEWISISQDLATVVGYAQNVSKISDGAFDITVAPAINAWGFGPANASAAPSSDALLEARQHSGYLKLELRESPLALRKLDPQLQIDLSAIAKGYAVDQLAYLLEDRGIDRYLVEIGGEIRTSGTRPDEKSWRIGIQPPEDNLNIEYVVIPDGAIATSGDYRNFYLLDEQRISHTINPGNARPVSNSITSASVLAPDAMQADALATALMVMGADKAEAFAADNDIAMLLLVRTETGIRAIISPAFQPYLLAD